MELYEEVMYDSKIEGGKKDGVEFVLSRSNASQRIRILIADHH